MSKTNKTKVATLMLSSLIFIILASTNSLSFELEPYFGVGYGGSDIDTGASVPTGTATLDENDSSYKFFAGFPLNRYLALEFFYSDLGEAVLSGNTGDTFDFSNSTETILIDDLTISSQITTYGFFGILNISLGEITNNKSLYFINLFFKSGLNIWDLDISVAANGVSITPVSDKGESVVVGTGVEFNLYKNFTLRTEYEKYSVNDDADYVNYVDSWHISTIFHY